MIRPEVALNDLGWRPEGRDQATGRALLDGLAGTYSALLCCLGVHLRLHHVGVCSHAEVAPDYRLATWFKDRQASTVREARQLLLSGITKHAPAAEALDAEYRVDDVAATALGWAANHDRLLLSLDDGLFGASQVRAVRLTAEAGAADLTETKVDVRNAATPRHVDVHRRWLLQCPRDWQTWASEAPRLYPHLTIMDRAVRQAGALHRNLIDALHAKLCALDDYFRVNQPTELGPVIARQLHLRDEKAATLKARGDRQPCLSVADEDEPLRWHAAFSSKRLYLTLRGGRCHIVYIGEHP